MYVIKPQNNFPTEVKNQPEMHSIQISHHMVLLQSHKWQNENVHIPRFFKKVCAHAGTHDVVTLAETNLNVFTKPTAIVISCRLCISNGLMFTHTLLPRN